VRDVVEKLAAEPRGLLVIEERSSAEFLIGERRPT
jgi:hypothetical protein